MKLSQSIPLTSSSNLSQNTTRFTLMSVSDKAGLLELAYSLQPHYTLLASGGTAQYLMQANLFCQIVEDYTQSPPCLSGRVKTLHPAIFAGILARRSHESHLQELSNLKIQPIDIVICNLYPFEHYLKHCLEKYAVESMSQMTPHMLIECEEELTELIDIGGVALLRAAAKNYKDVIVMCDSKDYELVTQAQNSITVRRMLAIKAWKMIHEYDACILEWFTQLHRHTELPVDRTNKVLKTIHDTTDIPKRIDKTDETDVMLSNRMPSQIHLTLTQAESLRYGENPNQQAGFYKIQTDHTAMSHYLATSSLQFIQGQKALSYNNYLDLETAAAIPFCFSQATVAIIKHCTPCGIGSDTTLSLAFKKAFDCDSQSAFGSVISANQIIDLAFVMELRSLFVEALLAPQFTEEALNALKRYKPSCRVLYYDNRSSAQEQVSSWHLKSACGGFLVQSSNLKDQHLIKATRHNDVLNTESMKWSVVTKRSPSSEEWQALNWSWKVVEHVKSNAIVMATHQATIGIGTGQTSRVLAVEQAARQVQLHPRQEQWKRESRPIIVMASDAFFPFADGIEKSLIAGVSAVIQPGGSKRDSEVIQKADKLDLAMVFTHRRCFKH